MYPASRRQFIYARRDLAPPGGQAERSYLVLITNAFTARPLRTIYDRLTLHEAQDHVARQGARLRKGALISSARAPSIQPSESPQFPLAGTQPRVVKLLPAGRDICASWWASRSESLTTPARMQGDPYLYTTQYMCTQLRCHLASCHQRAEGLATYLLEWMVDTHCVPRRVETNPNPNPNRTPIRSDQINHWSRSVVPPDSYIGVHETIYIASK